MRLGIKENSKLKIERKSRRGRGNSRSVGKETSVAALERMRYGCLR